MPNNKYIHTAFVVILVISFKIGFGQNSTIWFEEGAILHYGYGEGMEARTAGYEKLEVKGDTVAFCQEYRIIHRTRVYSTGMVMKLDLETGIVTNMSNADNQYDEPEGIFPDEKHTLVECDRVTGAIDIYKLILDGSGNLDRITFFSDYKGYKSSNPVVRDDGRYVAFQMARDADLAGIGYGLFIMGLEKAKIK